MKTQSTTFLPSVNLTSYSSEMNDRVNSLNALLGQKVEKFRGKRTIINCHCESCGKKDNCDSFNKNNKWYCKDCLNEFKEQARKSSLQKIKDFFNKQFNTDVFNSLKFPPKEIFISKNLVEKIQAIVNAPVKEVKLEKSYFLGKIENLDITVIVHEEMENNNIVVRNEHSIEKIQSFLIKNIEV